MCLIITKNTKKYVLKRDMTVSKEVDRYIYSKQVMSECFAFIYASAGELNPAIKLKIVRAEGTKAVDGLDSKELEELGFTIRFYEWMKNTRNAPAIWEGYHFYILKRNKKCRRFYNAFFVIPKGSTVYMDKERGLGVASQIIFKSLK